MNTDFGEEGGKPKLATGQLIGAGLIWARAQFDRKANELVQINQWVKMTIEIFTKLKGDGIELGKVEAKFNEAKFDLEFAGQRLSRATPIKIEQDIYLDETRLLNGEILVLNKVVIRLADKQVQFALQPYLTAKDKIRGKMDKKGAGLKQPVLVNIQQMPRKLSFKFKQDSNVE